MSQIILSPRLASIYASISGLTTDSRTRVIQFFKGSVSSNPLHEILVPPNSAPSGTYSYMFSGLKSNNEYTIIIRVIDDNTDQVLETLTATAVTGEGMLSLSPTSTSIYATVSGLKSYNRARVIQFFKSSTTGIPVSEILVPANQVDGEYSRTFSGLKEGSEYTIIVRIIDYQTDEVLEEFSGKAVCGGTERKPSFKLSEVSSNSVTVELYRGNPSYGYYRLYLYDTVDETALYADWLKADMYPKQIGGLESGRLYKINVGYGNIYGAGVNWIGTQTFTTLTEFDAGHSDEGKFTMPDEMISRHVLRNNTGSLSTSSFNDVYTRVTITTSDSENSGEIAYSVGNDDGLELELACPWLGSDEQAAIKIATYVLSVMRTYKYSPYEASESLLDPAAELGDWVSFDSVTSEIVNLDINYERLFNADISAPTSNETEHEFPQGSTSKDSTKRYVDGMRAALEVELDRIVAMVENNNGRFQKLQVTLDGVIIQNENGQTIINGANIKTGSIELTEQMYNGSSFSGKIDTMDSATTTAQTTADNAQLSASQAIAAAAAAQSTANSKVSSSEAASIAASQIIRDLNTKYGITSENNHSVLTSSYIYSPNLVAGDGTAAATINHLGLLFGTYNSETERVQDNYARLGYEEINSMKLPVLTLGQGGLSPENGSGIMKKYVNGIWIGEYFADTNTTFSPTGVSASGLFFQVANNSLVLSPNFYGTESEKPSNPMNGAIFFVIN